MAPQSDASAPSAHENFKATSSARHAALKQRWIARKESSNPGDKDSTEAFWSRFELERDRILSEVAAAHGVSVDFVAALETRVKVLLDDLTHAASWLTPFDVKRATRDARQVEDAVAQLRKRIAPRKKFGFKKSCKEVLIKPKQPSEPTATGDEAAVAARDIANNIAPQRFGFFGERGRVLVWTESRGESVELQIDDLVDCVVIVPIRLAVLRVRSLVNCTVYCAAIVGPVYVERAQGSRLRLAARQLRIHDSHDTDFYVALASCPIIENCSAVRFAEYSLKWTAQSSEDLGFAELSIKPLAWTEVQDFNWLKPEPSPNFSLLPKADYQLSPPVVAQSEVAQHGLSFLPPDHPDDDRVGARL